MRTIWGQYAALALRQVAAESYLSLQGYLLTGRGLIEGLVRGANPPSAEWMTNTLRLTRAQAERFVAETEVVAQHANDATGFSATLMRDRETNQWHIAFRGTEFLKLAQGGDWERDGIDGADGEMMKHGLALTQLVQMRRVFSDWSQRFGLAGERLEVSGYSLGGHLAVGFSELYPQSVLEAVGFNSPTRGIWTEPGATLGEILDFHQLLLRFPDQAELLTRNDVRIPALLLLANRDRYDVPLVDSNHNVYRDPATERAGELTDYTFGLKNLVGSNWREAELPDFVQDRFRLVFGHALHGDVEIISGRGAAVPNLPVLIEGQPAVTGLGVFLFGGAGHTHSLTLLIDSLLVYDAIARLAPGLESREISYLLAAASLRRPGVFPGLSHRTQVEGDTLERGIDAWRRLFLGDAIEPLPWSAGLTGYGDLTARSALHAGIEELLELRAGAPELNVSVIDVRSSFDLAEILTAALSGSAAHRYALWSLSPFVVAGDDGLFALDGRAERLAALTPSYLQARAEFAHRFWQIASTPGSPDTSDLTLRYSDLGGRHDLYHARYFGGDRDLFHEQQVPRTVFGSIHADVIAGSKHADRLFGDDGADHLQGHAGNDYLEGGLGDDRLEGGLGADRLIGGLGFDVYVADSGDVIVDADGHGRVDFGDHWLGPGFMGPEPETWVSWDNALEYRREHGGLRVLGRSTTWSWLTGANRPHLFIEDWQPGELGIRLFDTPVPGNVFQDTSGHLGVSVWDGGARLYTGSIPGDPDARFRARLEQPWLTQLHQLAEPVSRMDFDAGSQVIFVYKHHGSTLWVNTGAGQDFFLWSAVDMANIFLRVDLGDGPDFFQGSDGVDLVVGGEGSDHLIGFGGNDVLAGEDDGDLLCGRAGADRLSGGPGADWLLGGGGSDTLSGGADNDHLYGDTALGKFAFDAGFFVPLYGFHYRRGDLISAFPGGYPFLEDAPVALQGADWLSGGAGEDRLFGGRGDDHLEGDAGRDLLVGEGGDDRLRGGDDDDVLIGDELPQLRTNDETVIENLSAPSDGDRRARFYLRERGGPDAPPGNDWLEGGRGNDKLKGGLGDDTYVYRVGWGLDIIDDIGGHDRLLLSGRAEEWVFMRDIFFAEPDALLLLPQRWLSYQGLSLLYLRNGHVSDTAGRIELIDFEDGTHWRMADQIAALREWNILPRFGDLVVFGLDETLGRVEALNVEDESFRARGSADFDAIDARNVDLLDEAGVSLGRGQTSLLQARRSGMDLILDVEARSGNGGAASGPGDPPADGGSTGMLPGVSAPLLRVFTLELEGWFDPTTRVDVIALDDVVIGMPDGAPVIGTSALDPYVEPGGRLEWRVPEGAFVTDPHDLLTYSLRSADGRNLPAWLSLDPISATLLASPGAGERGLFALELLATDLAGEQASRRFELNVGMPVAPRFLDLPQSLSLTVSGPGLRMPTPWRTLDPNVGDISRVQLLDERGLPSTWATATPEGVSVRPGLFDLGTHLLTVRLTDRDGLVADAPWQITVLAPLADPVAPTPGTDPGGDSFLTGTPGHDRVVGSRGDDILRGGAGDDWIDGGGGDDLYIMGPDDGIDSLMLYPNARPRIDFAPGIPFGWMELARGRDSVGLPILQLRITEGLGLDFHGLFTHEVRLIDGEEHHLTRLQADTLPDLTLHGPPWHLFALSDWMLGIEPVETTYRPDWFARPGSPAALAQAAAISPYRHRPEDPGLRLLGEASADVLVGAPTHDRLYGGGGADQITGLAGDDLLYGEAGDDHIEGGAGADWLSGGTGDDLLIGGAGHDHYVRGASGGHDRIRDREGSNQLWLVDGIGVRGFSLRGHDVRLDLDDGGSVTLEGGLDGNTIHEVLWAPLPGAEPTRQRALQQLLRDHGWADAEPRARADIFHMRFSTDVPSPRHAVSRLFDAHDGDPLQYRLTLLEAASSGRPDWLRLDPVRGEIEGRPKEDDGGVWLWQVEARDPIGQLATTRVQALVFDDHIRFGSGAADTLHAFPGRRSALYGLAGDDRLLGGPRDDVLAGGSGRDWLYGGGDSDRLLFSADRLAGPFDRVMPPAGGGAESIPLAGRWLSDDIFHGGADVDLLDGTEGDDAIRSHDAAGTLLIDSVEFFVLRGGNDLLALQRWMSDVEVFGGSGDDILFSGSGDDRLHGGADDDWLVSGAGHDLLAADGGNDRLHGGVGNDTYELRGEGVVRIEDTRGNDSLRWLIGDPNETLTVQRSGRDLHLWGDDGLRAEIAGWFTTGGEGRIERISTSARRLDGQALEVWLAEATTADGAPADAARVIPDALWSDFRWEDEGFMTAGANA